MAPVLERCDREGMRALDATSQRNRRLYERHGFAAEEPFAPPGGRRCGRCGASQQQMGSDTAWWNSSASMRYERWTLHAATLSGPPMAANGCSIMAGSIASAATVARGHRTARQRRRPRHGGARTRPPPGLLTSGSGPGGELVTAPSGEGQGADQQAAPASRRSYESRARKTSAHRSHRHAHLAAKKPPNAIAPHIT
jgi:hypothetical protein